MFNVDEGKTQADDKGPKTIEEMAEAPQKNDKGVAADIKSVETPKGGAFSLLVILATIVALVGVGILYLMNTSKQSNIQTKQTEFNTLYSQLTTGDLASEEKDVREIMAGQQSLNTALGSRIYWSKFWAELNAVTPKNVYYNSMTVDQQGSISVSGVAANFSSVAKLMVSLQQASVFSKVELTGTSLKDDGGKTAAAFSIKLNVNQSKLTY